MAAAARAAVEASGIAGSLSEIRREIADARDGAVAELGGVILQLRREIDDLRRRKAPADDAEAQLAALVMCKADLRKAAAEAICDTQIADIELECAGELRVCEPAAAEKHAPKDKPVVPYLRAGVQENFPHEALRRAGCYFFTLFRWAEQLIGRAIGEDKVVPMFELCVAAGHVAPNAFVNNPVAVINTIAQAERVRAVTMHSNDPNVRSSQPVHALRVQNGNFGVHFVLSVNGYTWDSLGSNAHNYRPAGVREIV